ncbi:conjugative transfer signal peptidase TraF [Sphingobium xenophagum]|uniref:Conjugative transfer signal peptidase TraF n=1 Tax=Sphingobium xenophagum TaxID=121428 RepID=A0ABU1WZT3_SPHXE|nr:S26 family signal peptidase [Sphingobium xenophagum]MDR7154842.1 conjugative transfer signal peptidase TraF [Sphingobium xenophagum]
MTRRGYVFVTIVAAQVTALLACIDPAPRLVWNATASAPIGLYAVSSGASPSVGDLALVMPDRHLAHWLARRHALPLGVPLIKHVAATAGQTVCRSGVTIMIDRRPVASARTHDRAGRQLPVWSGCRRLGSGEIMLLNAAVEDSLDGRYFGPLSAQGVIGTVRPILTRANSGAPFVWHGWKP